MNLLDNMRGDSLDVLYLPPGIARHAREAIAERTELPESHVRVSYTHTHSGPSLHTDVWVERGVDLVEPYVTGLIDQAAGVAWEAVESLRPARLAAGTGRCEIAVNRRFRRPEDGAVVVGRNPDGPVDHEVGVVRVDGTDGEPIATLLDYACHPITVGPDCDLLTPDYPGQAKRTVETATESTCLFLQGAAGDVGPVRGVARGGLEEYRPLGRRLGHAASRVWWRLDPTGRRERYAETLPSGAPLAVYETERPDPPDREIRVGTREISLDVRDLPSPVEAREAYDRATERLADLRKRDADEEAVGDAVTEARQAGIRAGVAERFAGRETASWELQAFALGDDVALAAVPGSRSWRSDGA